MPVYNEEAVIKAVVKEWTQVLDDLSIDYLFLPVNDGSRDQTLSILQSLSKENPRIQVHDKANSGHGRSCRVGYDLALEKNAQWILQIDSDGQCLPEAFPEFWQNRQDADCVFGFRQKRDDGLLRKLVSKASRLAVFCVTGKMMRDPNVPYRLMRETILKEALLRVPADFDVQNIALSLALHRMKNVRWKLLPITFPERKGGSCSLNLKKIMRMGWKMLVDLRRVS